MKGVIQKLYAIVTKKDIGFAGEPKRVCFVFVTQLIRSEHRVGFSLRGCSLTSLTKHIVF